MKIVLFLPLTQGVLGACDTLWYHEWRQRLPRQASARTELRLHAWRDLVYFLLFGSLAWVEWHGRWVWGLAALLLAEILLTLWDFVEEDRTRTLPPGERMMHALMGMVYGAFLVCFIPELQGWFAYPAGVVGVSYSGRSWLMSVMAVGVLGAGLRDLRAALRHTASTA